MIDKFIIALDERHLPPIPIGYKIVTEGFIHEGDMWAYPGAEKWHITSCAGDQFLPINVYIRKS